MDIKGKLYGELNKQDYPEEVTDGAEMAVCHPRPYMSLLLVARNTNTNTSENTNTNTSANTNANTKTKTNKIVERWLCVTRAPTCPCY